MSNVSTVFLECAEAIQRGELIVRKDDSDKEFHFQNWFRRRLESVGLHFESPGRNAYPDFHLVRYPEGFEVKGLAYPGLQPRDQVLAGLFDAEEHEEDEED